MNAPLKVRSGWAVQVRRVSETGQPERVCTIPEGKHKMTRSKLTRGLVAGAAAIATAAGLAAVPTAASAQSAPYYGSGYGQPGGYYDPCRRDTTNRSTVGGLSGAAIGAAVGSGIAARGVRTEGAVLGGLLGAVLGAKVGHDSAACAPGQAPYGQPAPYAQPAAMPYGTPYSGAPYDARPYSGGYGQQGEYHYGYSTPYEQGGYGQAYGYPVTQRTSSDDCQLAESPIYLPDGQIQKRFVRVCRDSSGRYQVVD